MAPAKPLIDVNPETKLFCTSKTLSGKSIAEAAYKSNLRCISSSKDTNLIMERGVNGQVEMPIKFEDAEVDVIGCSNSGNVRWSDSQDPDATENSSSFGGTLSDSENCSGLSEAEVESQFDKDTGLPPFDAFTSMLPLRKKKLTNHWRNFIRPLMWRCKWTELRIKETESQALKYSKALSSYEQSRYSGLEEFISEDLGAKSRPFRCQPHGRKIMKRRKRKRVEDMTDISSYMSNHILFSYLENKRSDHEATFMPDDIDKTRIDNNEFGGNNVSSLEFGEVDVTLEEVLQKIEVVYSRISKLRCQLDIIMSQNAAKFSSSENLSLLAPFEAQTSSAPSPTFSAGNEEIKSAGVLYSHNTHILPEYDMENLVLPESVVSSYGEAVSVPDVIESTVGLLSAADVTLHLPMVGDTKEDIVENVLIENDVAEGESQMLRSSSAEPIVKHVESGRGEQDESPDPSPNLEPKLEHEPMLPDIITQQQQPNLQSGLASDIHVPMNKRKRGERKSGVGGWSKKCSGEPDSQ